MKLVNFFLLLISFNLISDELDQLNVDFLDDDEYRIDLIFIKYLKDEVLKETFQDPSINFERFFVILDEFKYPNLDIVATDFEVESENQSIDIPFIKKEAQKKAIEKNIITRKRELPRKIFQIDKRDDNLMNEFKDLIRRSRYFRFIGEQSWYQPIPTKDNSFEIFIDSSIERGSRIFGFIKPYKGRYLHTDIEVFLAEQTLENKILSVDESDNTNPNLEGYLFNSKGLELQKKSLPNFQEEELTPIFRLQESRRLRSGEINYFDHPKFGLLLLITKPG
jgi:hypothetical protein